MRVSAFQGASNTETYTVKRNGVEFDLNAAGVTRIEIVESGKTIDSTTDAVNYNGSLLTVKWAELGDRLMTGKFSPYIYAYKAGDTKGELIFGPNLSPIYLTVIADERP